MKERFNQTINSVIASSVLALIAGLIMIFFPKISVETIGMIVSIYIIIHGLILVYLDVVAYEYYIPFDGLISGILSVLLGTILLCKPDIIPVVFTIVLGIWIILSSINYIKMGIKISNTNLPWLRILLLGILDLIAGLIVIFNPFEATISLTLFAGIMIVAHAIINIVDMILIKKDVKDISKTLKEITKK